MGDKRRQEAFNGETMVKNRVMADRVGGPWKGKLKALMALLLVITPFFTTS